MVTASLPQHYHHHQTAPNMYVIQTVQFGYSKRCSIGRSQPWNMFSVGQCFRLLLNYYSHSDDAMFLLVVSNVLSPWMREKNNSIVHFAINLIKLYGNITRIQIYFKNAIFFISSPPLPLHYNIISKIWEALVGLIAFSFSGFFSFPIILINI